MAPKSITGPSRGLPSSPPIARRQVLAARGRYSTTTPRTLNKNDFPDRNGSYYLGPDDPRLKAIEKHILHVQKVRGERSASWAAAMELDAQQDAHMQSHWIGTRAELISSWRSRDVTAGLELINRELNPNGTTLMHLSDRLPWLSPKDRGLLLSFLIQHYSHTPFLRAFIHRYARVLTHTDFGGSVSYNAAKNDYRRDADSVPMLANPGVNLDGMHLRQFIPSASRLIGSSFRDSIFIDAKLDRVAGMLCDFTGADLSNTDLWNAHFAHARFDLANLNHADLHEAIFYRCSFHDAMTEGTNVDLASFRDCDLPDGFFEFSRGTPRVYKDGRLLTKDDPEMKRLYQS